MRMAERTFEGSVQYVDSNVEEALDRVAIFCCFFAMRFAMISLTADSANPVDILVPAR